MTRRRDLMCEDIFGCDHKPETPITDSDGDILYWQRRCGERHKVPGARRTPQAIPQDNEAKEK